MTYVNIVIFLKTGDAKGGLFYIAVNRVFIMVAYWT
jgi:hypothetical protein